MPIFIADQKTADLRICTRGSTVFMDFGAISYHSQNFDSVFPKKDMQKKCMKFCEKVTELK